MDRKKRSGKLSISNGDPLKKLDAFIKEQAEAYKPIQSDEFTVYDYIERMKEQGIKIGMSKAIRTMSNLIDDGVVSSRKASFGRNQMNFYRFL